jgi:hypothetical protein
MACRVTKAGDRVVLDELAIWMESKFESAAKMT